MSTKKKSRWILDIEAREARMAATKAIIDTPREQYVVKTEMRSCGRNHEHVYEAKQIGIRPLTKKPEALPFWDDFLTYWTNCPICNSEWQAEANAFDEEVRGGLSAKKIAAARMLTAAGIPKRYEEATIWNWQHPMDRQRRIWEWAQDYATQFALAIEHGRSGVFTGASGTGKTHLSIGVLRHIVEKGGTGRYVTVMDMLGRIKSTYHKDSAEKEADVIRDYSTVDMLVIDEIGKQLDTGYEHAQLFRILDKRYAGQKPVILVSNLVRAKLIEFLGEAVVDRLRENGGALLTFDWVSQRSTKKPKVEDASDD